MRSYFRLLAYFKKYWLYVIGVLICIALYSSSILGIMQYVKSIVEMIEKGSMKYFQGWTLNILGLILLKNMSAFGKGYWMAIVGNRMVMDIRMRIYKNLHALSLDFFTNWRTGELISRATSDTGLIGNTLIEFFSQLIPELLTAIGTIVYLFFLNPKYTLIIIITIPFYSFAVSKTGTFLKSLAKKSSEKLANTVSLFQEAISNIKIVKAFSMEKHEIRKYAVETNKNLRLNLREVRTNELSSSILDTITLLVVVFILWYAGKEIILGNLAASDLAPFVIGLAVVPNSLMKVSKVFYKMQKSIASADRFFELIDIKPSVKEKKKAIRLKTVTGKIEFKNVSFFYKNADGKVLENINLTVNPGEILAIVGRSGAGKTTLANLVPRFYDVSSGEVLLDGHNIKDVSFFSLRNNMGLVPQETMLFNATIEENILYGRPNATKEEIVSAAESANAHQFISLFPDAYNTIVGERGVRLSGGQRQRIAIARTILRNPKILILDEATSALDTESEKLVQDALNRLMQNRTTFVIAHRLSTIIHADKIIVMDKGKIVEMGKHEELIANNKTYKNLHSLQFKV